MGLTTFTKLLGVVLDFWASRVDDGLDLAELLVAQAELFGQSRQHVLEEAQPVAAPMVAESTVTSAVKSLVASPGAAGSASVSWPGSCLGEDRRRCSED
jgi:hypothetical protein